MASFGAIASSLGNALQQIGTYSQNAAARANAISAASQSAQGNFNQASADTANALNLGAMQNQYGYNTAMMQAANNYNTAAWERAAAWNEEMWQRQADFNAKEAQKQREWQTEMANTQYQRAIGDMEKAGLNPILAVTGGGVGTQVPGGAVASAGSASMSGASSAQTSGGLLGANAASEGNYSGQMEQMGTTLALLGAIFAGISSAADAANGLGPVGEKVIDTITDELTTNVKAMPKEVYKTWKQGLENKKDSSYKPNYRNGIDWNMKDYGGSFYKANNSKAYQFRLGHAKG